MTFKDYPQFPLRVIIAEIPSGFCSCPFMRGHSALPLGPPPEFGYYSRSCLAQSASQAFPCRVV